MDKSFNEKELSDIMKEIEALEEDFSGSPESAALSVVADLVQMDVSESVPVGQSNVVSLDSHSKEVLKEHAAPAASNISKVSPHSEMSFNIQGSMAVQLNFNIGGKSISLDVTEVGLTIEMEGGVKFTVPVGESHSFKKAV